MFLLSKNSQEGDLCAAYPWPCPLASRPGHRPGTILGPEQSLAGATFPTWQGWSRQRQGQTGGPPAGCGTIPPLCTPSRHSLAAKAGGECDHFPLSRSDSGSFSREPDLGGRQPPAGTVRRPSAHTDTNAPANTPAPRSGGQAGSALTAQPAPERGPRSHQEGPEVTQGRPGRPRP